MISKRSDQAVSRLAALDAGRLLSGRFTGLTVVLLTVSLAADLIPNHDVRDLFVDLAFSVLLTFAVWSVDRRLRLLTVLIAAPAFIGQWSLHLAQPPLDRWLIFTGTAIFLGYLALVVLTQVFRATAVTADTIVGAVCAYFLLGVTWGYAYTAVADLTPGAFAISPALMAAYSDTQEEPLRPLLQYFSFTTLSTAGFGDISPVTPAARTLVALEALLGPLYLAILIARLVGMHTARVRERS